MAAFPYFPNKNPRVYPTAALEQRLRELLSARAEQAWGWRPSLRRWQETQIIAAELAKRGESLALCQRVAQLEPEEDPPKSRSHLRSAERIRPTVFYPFPLAKYPRP